MCPNFVRPLQTPKQQAGFSLPVAVFVVVIMALLAAAIVQLSSRNNLSSAQEVFSVRAFYSAESGASWAMSQLFFNSAGSANKAFSDTRCSGSVNGATLTLPSPGLAGCSATLTCVAETEGATGYYRVVSAGSCGSGQVQASRVVEVSGRNNL